MRAKGTIRQLLLLDVSDPDPAHNARVPGIYTNRRDAGAGLILED